VRKNETWIYSKNHHSPDSVSGSGSEPELSRIRSRIVTLDSIIPNQLRPFTLQKYIAKLHRDKIIFTFYTASRSGNEFTQNTFSVLVFASNKNSAVQFQLYCYPFTFVRCASYNWRIYLIAGRALRFPFWYKSVPPVISHRVTTVSNARSSWYLWPSTFCFSAGDTIVARRWIPLIRGLEL